MAEPGRAPLVRVPSGACSRADAKGEGAPTGMSATTAVAGRPIYTSPAYGESVPKAFRAKPESPMPAKLCFPGGPRAAHRTNLRSKSVPARLWLTEQRSEPFGKTNRRQAQIAQLGLHRRLGRTRMRRL